MGNKELQDMAQLWLDAKQREALALKDRRAIEDNLLKVFSAALPGEGVWSHVDGDVQIKISNRINRIIDSDKLQELAAEAGLTDCLGTLFRWKPEIDIRQWMATDKTITAPLEGAIASKPGRPSFTITIKQEQEK